MFIFHVQYSKVIFSSAVYPYYLPALVKENELAWLSLYNHSTLFTFLRWWNKIISSDCPFTTIPPSLPSCAGERKWTPLTVPLQPSHPVYTFLRWWKKWSRVTVPLQSSTPVYLSTQVKQNDLTWLSLLPCLPICAGERKWTRLTVPSRSFTFLRWWKKMNSRDCPFTILYLSALALTADEAADMSIQECESLSWNQNCF